MAAYILNHSCLMSWTANPIFWSLILVCLGDKSCLSQRYVDFYYEES